MNAALKTYEVPNLDKHHANDASVRVLSAHSALLATTMQGMRTANAVG